MAVIHSLNTGNLGSVRSTVSAKLSKLMVARMHPRALIMYLCLLVSVHLLQLVHQHLVPEQ
eukprot:2626231-Amphidinium_carterae.1